MSKQDFVITPLQAYAHEAHELFQAFLNAGFGEGEAWELLMRNLPDWEFPEPLLSMNLEEIEEEDEEDADD
jgi:hypothetical protein